MTNHDSDSKWSRRTLLTKAGAAGAIVASAGLLGHASLEQVAAGASVTSSVYGGDGGAGCCCKRVTLAELRTEPAPTAEVLYLVTDPGQEGWFVFDSSDTVSADNTGTVVVSTDGSRYKRLYDDMISLKWFGAKGDGVTEDTAAFQAAFDAAAGRKLFVPKQRGGYYLSHQLFIRSRTTVEFEAGTIVQAVDTLSVTAPYEKLFRLLDVSDVRIIGNGAVLRMNKAAYTTGEHAHIFDISGSSNITIEHVNANDSGGDGFYIGAYQSVNTVCRNIVFVNCQADNNRRQGMSIISADGLLADNCRFTNTIGTAPQAGVDIEPNHPGDRLRNIRFVNCVAEGNKSRGFMTMIKKLSPASEQVDIVFQNCVSRNNAFGFATVYGKDGSAAAKGEVKYIDCRAEYEKWSGFFELSSSADSVRTTYVRCTAYNCNVNNGTGAAYSYAASFFISSVTSEARASVGNSHFYDCRSIDDRSPSLIRRGFATYGYEGFEVKDLVFRECESIGHTVSPFQFDENTRNIRVEQSSPYVYPVSASGTVSLNWLGGVITNAGATETIELALPPAREGFGYTFRVEAAHAIRLVPQSGDVIMSAFGTGWDVSSADIGDSLTLHGRDDGGWLISNCRGSWLPLSAPHVKLPYRTVTADTTLDGRDSQLIADASVQPIVVTLPQASDAAGMKFVVKKLGPSANAVHIQTTGSEPIDGGGASITLRTAGEFRRLFSIGTGWITV
ncbi:right-handed parallel beta-helix repeat-containing protein [Paenibacillus mesophilus]|uniref:right-handed parallel beta-helix repeat-containing protein n=1 Tax=Paenibacillus mesophilus TaxID=2582849 RepID=UPI00110EB973|nr:right-handed parallel beta-helix repeat-containing protein [Paenibacillus mesophilus]TMV48697.1 right-handed parallel beta-helix repeat-containing protein [Paenibacillus mesophilus]